MLQLAGLVDRRLTLGLVLSGLFFSEHGFGDVVAFSAGSCCCADAAGFLVKLEDGFCGFCPVVGPWFNGVVLDVAFPLVFSGDLGPGYFKDDLQDITKMLDADGVLSFHGFPLG